MKRAVTLLLTALALVLLLAIPAMAGPTVTPPSKAPSYRTNTPVVVPPTFAESIEVGRRTSVFGKQLRKLGRGILNFFTGPLEIPKNIARVWRDTDPVTGTVVGGIEGIGWAVARSATGAYDAVTFLIPVPADYEPLMDPEFILPEVWGASIPGLPEER